MSCFVGNTTQAKYAQCRLKADSVYAKTTDLAKRTDGYNRCQQRLGDGHSTIQLPSPEGTVVAKPKTKGTAVKVIYTGQSGSPRGDVIQIDDVGASGGVYPGSAWMESAGL